MQFIDLAAQQQRIKEKIGENIQRVLSQGKYIMGPEVTELEGRLADFTGTRHAIGCSSGTDALLLALMAFNVGPGDAVFTTPFTFIATAEVISLLGATPVFVDIDPGTFNMDPKSLQKAVSAIMAEDTGRYPLPEYANPSTIKARGIIAVDLFGLPADYEGINAVAGEHGLFVIEDAAQSFGAEYKNRRACSLADIACTSFFPAKPLGGYGDGGMCFTDDDSLAVKLRSLMMHGKGSDKYDNARIGINGRLDTLQAAILLAKFDIFPEEVTLRDEVAKRYTELLLGSALQLSTPHIPPGLRSAWAQYSILAESEQQRSLLQADLKENGIPSAVYYPKPLHLQTAFEPLKYRQGDFPISEDCSKRIFSLPMHPYLGEGDQKKITEILGQVPER